MMTLEEKAALLGGRQTTPEEQAKMDKLFGKRRFSSKYMQALKNTITYWWLRELYEEQPDLPLNQVVAILLKDQNPELTKEMLLEITQHIMEEWEKKKQAQPSVKLEEEEEELVMA